MKPRHYAFIKMYLVSNHLRKYESGIAKYGPPYMDHTVQCAYRGFKLIKVTKHRENVWTLVFSYELL